VVLARQTAIHLMVFSRLVLDLLVAMVALVPKMQQMAARVVVLVETQAEQLLA
jgi:hypothetical protein